MKSIDKQAAGLAFAKHANSWDMEELMGTIIRLVAICGIVLVTPITSYSAESTKPESASDVVCSYAPSQSKTIAGISGAAGGAAATTAGIASALGLGVVSHSSGALILTGAGSYIAGTLGVTLVAPIVITVGAIVGGTAVTVELLCAPKNHADGYKKVVDAAQEFGRRTGSWVQDAKDGLKTASTQTASFSSINLTAIKGKATSLYDRAFCK